jgi:peptide-methionine (S)-S-oxide reductase
MVKILSIVAVVAVACVAIYLATGSQQKSSKDASTEPGTEQSTATKDVAKNGHAVATFAGGCFWCMEPPFDKLNGVISTTSGYTGGTTPNPTYEHVSTEDTGHYEAIEVIYDPKAISYEELLEVFWKNVDPTQANGQFCDIGNSYLSAIFVHDNSQREAAEETKANWSKEFDKELATEILNAPAFYIAEDYHQDYYQKNPLRYKYYRYACGRDAQLQQVWAGK